MTACIKWFRSSSLHVRNGVGQRGRDTVTYVGRCHGRAWWMAPIAPDTREGSTRVKRAKDDVTAGGPPWARLTKCRERLNGEKRKKKKGIISNNRFGVVAVKKVWILQPTRQSLFHFSSSCVLHSLQLFHAGISDLACSHIHTRWKCVALHRSQHIQIRLSSSTPPLFFSFKCSTQPKKKPFLLFFGPRSRRTIADEKGVGRGWKRKGSGLMRRSHGGLDSFLIPFFFPFLFINVQKHHPSVAFTNRTHAGHTRVKRGISSCKICLYTFILHQCSTSDCGMAGGWDAKKGK